jgi:hypothetical protein
MAIKTQGTNLYLIDGSSVLNAGCVTSISGITAARDQIEVTCLDDDARHYVAGLVTPGAASFTINFDPSDSTHQNLHDLYVSGERVKWALGWSESDDAPTINTDGTFDYPTTRSFLEFDGYISDFPFEFGLSDVVKSTVAIQMSGFPLFIAASS